MQTKILSMFIRLSSCPCYNVIVMLPWLQHTFEEHWSQVPRSLSSPAFYHFQIYYITNITTNIITNTTTNITTGQQEPLTKHPVEEVKFGSWKLHGVRREKLHHALLLDKIMWQVGPLLEENVREHSRGSEALASTDDSQQYHCYYD